ncbi:zinc ribbon domain-containing protein [Providencia rettgeri]|uniref:ORC-CDC6 family AAA ATPase n=1 Tax=Providencia sp. PROV270 TaxID=2949958 RepID=UPI001DDE5796|nr:zinc ribbon domain-containing protein [Providencia sp. PROV270]EHZ6871296.1 zinc ribbon domain-containing protein [Providencia rettgeri]
MKSTNKDLLEQVIEQRADFIPLDELKKETSASDFFNRVVENLTGRKTILIVGPRGCGKTHMMRYSSLICLEDKAKPFAVYVSFNKYYRLEPLLTAKIDAIELFHSWVLAQILHSTFLTLVSYGISESDIEKHSEGVTASSLRDVINQLEKGASLKEENQSLIRKLSISNVKNFIDKVRQLCGRKRTILLLDDAALTLTPDYMSEFFDVFKNLKSIHITPKASVYPGTTEYGARFHPTQEGEIFPVWLSVEEPSYSQSMQSIADTRIADFENIPKDVNEYLKLASFGIPRAYLSMLQEFQNNNFSTTQQGLNRIIQQHVEHRIEEFRSIQLKSPKLKNILEVGEDVFNDICNELKKTNDTLNKKNVKQLRFGISGINEYPFVERMFNLLIEAGLLYELPSNVSHGKERDYMRYIPHISCLLNKKIFSESERGFSLKKIIENINLPPAKHPVRRSVTTIMKKDVLKGLSFNLPKCTICGADRINSSQKFCHNCGAELISVSTFEQCMSIPLTHIPGLTSWQVQKIKNELPKFKNIGDFLSSQDPSRELRKAQQIGVVRAEKIIRLVLSYVDEFFQ